MVIFILEILYVLVFFFFFVFGGSIEEGERERDVHIILNDVRIL